MALNLENAVFWVKNNGGADKKKLVTSETQTVLAFYPSLGGDASLYNKFVAKVKEVTAADTEILLCQYVEKEKGDDTAKNSQLGIAVVEDSSLKKAIQTSCRLSVPPNLVIFSRKDKTFQEVTVGALEIGPTFDRLKDESGNLDTKKMEAQVAKWKAQN